MKPDEKQLYEKTHRVAKMAVEKFGVIPQKIKIIEELGELMAIVAKSINEPTGHEDKVADEMADVLFMLLQAQIIYDNQKLVKERLAYKVDRLATKIMREELGLT